ncbi:MAG: hypothetical protein N3B01_03700 [Verrucomicrobiae bacterium]|nr:hypothetical protein [Verrucomicrobiae bacterium]
MPKVEMLSGRFRGLWAGLQPHPVGGKILRATTLNYNGQGSFLEAVNTSGPRIIVFEVGGVINFSRQTIGIRNLLSLLPVKRRHRPASRSFAAA